MIFKVSSIREFPWWVTQKLASMYYRYTVINMVSGLLFGMTIRKLNKYVYDKQYKLLCLLLINRVNIKY